MSKTNLRFIGGLLLTATSLAMTGCGAKKSAAGGPPADAAVRVVVAAARHQAVTETLSLVGSLVPNELVEIKSETDGTVHEILFTEGQSVKKGDLLFRLDESKYAAAVAEAEANFKLNKATLDRIKQLSASGTAAQQEYDQALAAFEVNQATLDLRKRELADARIYAPFDGVMSTRLVSPGQVISKNTMLGSIVSVDPVKVEFDVPERFLSLARIGQTIEISVAGWPGETFGGEVFFIAPRLDPDTRTALVKARLPNRDQKLKPGMFANLDVTLRVREQAVVIPESAVILQENRVSVFVVDSNGLAQPRLVKIGQRMPGLLEIIDGVQAGETVIIEGTQKVRPGGKVAPQPAAAS